jgi:hypothetical protein
LRGVVYDFYGTDQQQEDIEQASDELGNKMKTIRIAIVFVAVLFLSVAAVRAQDISKYRTFSLGASVESVLKQTSMKTADLKALIQQPALIQELTWWPPAMPGVAHRSDAAQQILFSFYNGELYKICVTYDRSAIEGLTEADMVQSLSSRYGVPTKASKESQLLGKNYSDTNSTIFATWENGQSSLTLIHSYTDEYALLLVAKAVGTQADVAIVESAKLEEQQRPEKEAELRKKEAGDLDTARQKNKKSFQP